jgi:hypothetical protein
MTARGRRPLRRVAVRLLAAATVGFAACRPAGAPVTGSDAAERLPRDASRFEIASVGDTSLTFRPQEARWVRTGQVAYVVDPARADALVARVRVAALANGRATAIVTGQLARVSASHVVVIVRPRPAPWRTRAFWFGAAGGALVGGAVAGIGR